VLRIVDVTSGERTFRFAELSARSNSVANNLRSLGVRVRALKSGRLRPAERERGCLLERELSADVPRAVEVGFVEPRTHLG